MCGAGDRFATALVERLGAGVPLTGAATVAVERAASFVRGGGVQGLVPGPPLDVPVAADDARTVPPALVSRDRGLRVVAAGGCFDLLHAGHVRLLEVARSMGDVLVVCLNSDASVRRLKGPGRPIVGERDRRRVLVGLASVDHVVVFDEPTPARVLDSLRPDVFVKGSDYFGRDLPESGQLARWGGEVVTVPLLPGRSTSGLVSTVLEDAATA
jgi:rfaE bifunctional protein nucleotidyltransferase chain/domain